MDFISFRGKYIAGRNGRLAVVKFHDMEAATIDIEMNVPLLEIRSDCLLTTLYGSVMVFLYKDNSLLQKRATALACAATMALELKIKYSFRRDLTKYQHYFR